MGAELQPFTVVEIDLPTCANTYGTAPCTASVGVTGAQKWFNTLRTCQDRANLVANTTTLRLCMPRQNIPYDAFPCLDSVSVTPGVIDPGRSIGQRGKVQISAGDFPTGDALLDHYLGDRSYAPFQQGTFWPKLRARIPSLQGAPLRILRGTFGADLSTFAVEYYFVESMLIDGDGVDIVAKDALSLTDPKKAQCPVLSTGRLADAISDVAITVDLSPAGVGDLDYPASGYLCFSNKEIVAFTRSSDSLSLTRSRFGTKAIEHDADAVAQLVVVFEAQSVADIVYALLTTYTPGVDPAWCDLATWQAEADLYIGHLYTAVIPAPTSVKTLLDEMMEQAGCSLWWDPQLQKIMFQTLRPVAPGAFVVTPDKILEGTFKAKEQPDKRISQHWTYYGLADPTNKVDKEANFRSAVARIDANSEADYGSPAFAKVLARWIEQENRPAAERLNAMKLSRFKNPPRLGGFALFAGEENAPGMGEGVFIQDHSLQLPDGTPDTVPFYITSAEKQEDKFVYQVEELNFSEDEDDSERLVFIDVDQFNLNLRDLYDSLYSSIPYGVKVTFYLSPGAWVGGMVLGSPSVDVGDWPEGTDVWIEIGTADNADAKFMGRGGNGGGYPGYSANGSSGEDGSTALYTRYPVTIRLYGDIAGGGGGGQAKVGTGGDPPAFYAAGAGGGAGFNDYIPLSGGVRRGGLGGSQDGADGGTNLGGVGATKPNGTAGNGGDIAFEGDFNDGGGVGHTAAGVAIDGYSYCTFDVLDGAILGDTIN